MTPMARNTDPETSHEAARLARARNHGPGPEVHAGTDRARALIALHHHPAGLTDFELAFLTDRAQTSIGKRRKELLDAGYVTVVMSLDGKRPHTRMSPSMARARVWRCTAAGHELAQRLMEVEW